MEVESGQEGADARAWGKDATDEATPDACPAAAAPVPPEGSVAAILEAVRVLGERADAEDLQVCSLVAPGAEDASVVAKKVHMYDCISDVLSLSHPVWSG